MARPHPLLSASRRVCSHPKQIARLPDAGICICPARRKNTTDSPDTWTRERWEQEVRGLALGDFDQIAKGRRTFTISELRAMPEAMQRCIKSIKVRTVRNAGDGTADQVVDVKLWGKAQALKLAARAGIHGLGSPRK